jgi:hypothetical protein
MAECAARGWTRVVFVGVSELAEVGVLCAYEHPIKIVAIVDPAHAGTTSCGLSVKTTLAECGRFDAAIITTLTTPEAAFKKVRLSIEPERIFAPRLLRLDTAVSAARNVSSQAAE